MAGALAAEVGVGDIAKLGVDDGGEQVEGRAIALGPTNQELSDVTLLLGCHGKRDLAESEYTAGRAGMGPTDLGGLDASAVFCVGGRNFLCG